MVVNSEWRIANGEASLRPYSLFATHYSLPSAKQGFLPCDS